MEELRKTSQATIIQPVIPVDRQVYFVYAILILVGIVLGNSVNQWFYMLNILVGLDLLIASFIGVSLSMKMFSKFIWNKPFVKKI
ncbi:MAG: hypothetical protein PHC75_08965 [Burkholderiales bacterium]|nr:hypothetical protein [Burkholderiales bacterium]